PVFNLVRRRRKPDMRLARNVVESPINKRDSVGFHDRGKILAMLLPRHPAHLKNVYEVCVEEHLQREVDVYEIEVLEAQTIKKNLGSQQLLTPDMYRVLRKVKGITQRDVAGRELNLRGKGLLRTGREDNAAVPSDSHFQMAQEAGVIVKETDVG